MLLIILILLFLEHVRELNLVYSITNLVAYSFDFPGYNRQLRDT